MHLDYVNSKQSLIYNNQLINVSHLSPIPYKLTGRKFLIIKINGKGGFRYFFDSLVVKELYFKDFLEKYL